MMLLTAFILVIGFVALAGMVARLSQLPEETQAITQRPIFREAEALTDAAQVRLDDLAVATPPVDATEAAALKVTVEAQLDQMDALMASRGYSFVGTATCDGTDPNAILVGMDWTMTDQETTFEIAITTDAGPGVCWA